MSRVVTGLEVLRQEGFSRLKGKRIGLVCHPASVDAGLEHAVSVLHAAPGVTLAALFGPQHGIRGETQANMIEWRGYEDPLTGLPVYSLYGETREPTAAMLRGLDALVVDLQDVGARPYTYASTLALCMRAAADQGLEVVVLDRPNPIGGQAIEGPMLDRTFVSFVGLFPIPLRHGLTMGEMARLFREVFGLACKLTVVPMGGWRRRMDFKATGLPWVLPSPNMPTVDTAFVYPGMILLEGTNLSEGRGTTRPFEICGAPFLDGILMAECLAREPLAGLKVRPLGFKPTFDKHAGVVCGGVQLHVTDRQAFRPVLAAGAGLREGWGQSEGKEAGLRWTAPPYEYELTRLPIDIVAGTDQLRAQVEALLPLEESQASCAEPLAAFRKLCKPILLYE